MPRLLNARRHRGGNHQGYGTTTRSVNPAQRPEASGRQSLAAPGAIDRRVALLNARRHRGGNHRVLGRWALGR